jgi:hypothetical protein
MINCCIIFLIVKILGYEEFEKSLKHHWIEFEILIENSKRHAYSLNFSIAYAYIITLILSIIWKNSNGVLWIVLIHT